MNLQNLYTAKEASLLLGKEESYVRQLYKKFPDKFKKGTIRKIGRELIITKEGVDHLK